MNKSVYQQPQLHTMDIGVRHHLLAGSDGATSVGGNVFEGAIKAGDGTGVSTPRSRESSGWFDDEE